MATSDPRAAPPGPGRGPDRALSVSELNRGVRSVLEASYGDVWIRGEVSRFKAYGSGHWYFTLKDSEASVSGVMFRGANRLCRVRPEDGLEVLVRGRVSLYEPRGQYQVVVEHLEPAGEGALFLAFERLKKRLAEEGLFDEAQKQDLPLLPRRIGIATSLDGAALRDILRVLRTRGARLSVVIAGCRVQGAGAAEEVAAALRRLDDLGDLDAVIVGRGGGSLEDLWAFNEEVVARTIHAMSVPVVSAVGHEIDTTIADLVADVRAATPSQAAELACASRTELEGRLRNLVARLSHATRGSLRSVRERLVRLRPDAVARLLRHRLERRSQHADALLARARVTVVADLRRSRERFGALERRLAPTHLLAGARRRRERLDGRLADLRAMGRRGLTSRREKLGALVRALEALSPVAVLERGYSVLQRDDGRVVRVAADVERGDAVTALLGHRDRLSLTVRETLPATPAEEGS